MNLQIIHEQQFENAEYSHMNSNSNNVLSLIESIQLMTKYLQQTFKQLSTNISTYRDKISTIKQSIIHEGQPKLLPQPLSVKQNKIDCLKFQQEVNTNQLELSQIDTSCINYQPSLGVQVNDEDLLDLQSLQIDYNSLNAVPISRQQQHQLWQKSKNTQITSWFQNYVKNIQKKKIEKERKKQVAQASKLLKKQKMQQSNQQAKQKFEKLLSQKSKRQNLAQKSDAKEQLKPQQKIQINDLRAAIEKSKIVSKAKGSVSSKLN